MIPEARDVLEILWKGGETALLSTIFCYLLLDFNVENRDQIFHFELSGYSR